MSGISLIVPIFNVEKYLNRCIESVRSQSVENFEILLIDDGSSDNSGKISDYYVQLDSRVIVIHKLNGGLSDARNKGLDFVFTNSNIEWISFLDSDDWIYRGYLEILLQSAVANHCDIVACNFEETNGKVPFVDEKQIVAKTIDTEDFFCTYNVNATIACAKIYKKALFIDIRYPFGKIHEDEFTTYKVLYKLKSIAVVFASLYFYYFNPEGITKKKWNPRRLNSTEALSEQLCFFRLNGFEKSFYFSLGNMIGNIMHHCSVIPNSNENQKYIKFLRKKLRKHLRLCRKYDMFLFSNNRHIYEIAYPTFMRLYWRFKVAKSGKGKK